MAWLVPTVRRRRPDTTNPNTVVQTRAGRDSVMPCKYFFSNTEKQRFALTLGEARGGKGAKDVHNSEHVKRHHTPSYNCVQCGHRWPASAVNDTTLPQIRAAHLETCTPQHSRLTLGPRVEGPEIMTEEEEKKFRELKHIRRDNVKKLEELYKACGKDLPETYRA